ncbi:MAG: transketolase family protein [Nitrososphaeria archaeon]|nr:transketolase family protein [Nitrososphaeria archaeon]NDB50642.1 transketolase family protein [Nitrosopumilaceae archaeon]NDB88042.1 transketolase family protein [Nitrososphaerota archaeon]NDB46222.1 transketolase family protein [Nitrososphaeria archaeon]NDB62554.1 transketolase family protein [Nitrosopumilaceae archaeon]
MTDMRSAYGKALVDIGEQNQDVVVLGADTTDSLKTADFGKKFPNRFFNVGIAEANLVSVAAGLAISGKVPFASTYAIFLPGRCVDQIRNAIAYPSTSERKGLNVKLVVSHGGISVGADGGSHQQVEDYAIMRVMPNMTVLIPADTVAVSKLTWIMSQRYGPHYMRLTRNLSPIVHQDSQEFQIGKGIIMREGTDCTIAACGLMVKMALDAADSLKQEGINCKVIDMFSIKPIDAELLEKSARETGCIVTCEEHNIMGGFGSAISEVVSELYPVPIKRVGVNDRFGESARDAEIPLLFEKHGITSINIAKAVKEVIGKKK